ncbi:hypothetical protein JCM6882_006017 [Rhodosporidiobolus microsporus]
MPPAALNVAAYDALPSSPLPSPLPRELPASPVGEGGTSCLESPRRESFGVNRGSAGEEEKDLAAEADAQLLTRTLRLMDRRQMRYTLVLLGVFLVVFLRTFSSSSSSPSSFASAWSSFPSLSSSSHSAAPAPHLLPPTLVGPRPSTAPSGLPLFSTPCTADELLLAVQRAVVRPDGASRTPNATKQESVELKPLRWSFDLGEVPDGQGEGKTKSCGVPHVYSQEEACELLGAFGGIFNTGDSFSRHIHHALLIILRNRNDGGVIDYETTDDCREELGFAEGLLCRLRVPADTDLKPVCGGKAHMHYVWWLRPDPGIAEEILRQFSLWRAGLPRESQALSPVFLPSVGVHFNYTAPALFPSWLPLTLSYFARQFPSPLHLFAGPHAPPANQPEWYRSFQGRPRVVAFKQEVENEYEEKGGVIEREGYRGGGRYLDMYAMTDGAASFDGAHMGYIANMEKAHLILNFLDLWWSDIVAAGGLVQRD